MLNELYSMYLGLKAIDQIPETKHNDIQSPGMGTTFRVFLDKEGRAHKIQMLDKTKIRDTWSLGNGNKNQFPAVKLVFPLIPKAHQSVKEWKKEINKPDVSAYKSLIEKLSSEYEVSFNNQTTWPEYRSKVIERQETLANLKGTEASCVYELFGRYKKSENGLSILQDVAQLLIDRAKISTDIQELKAICDALFGAEVDNKGKVKDSNRVTFLLDFMPEADLDLGVSSRRWVPAISEALFRSESKEERILSTCALTGKEAPAVKAKFPSEKLSVIGNTILLTKPDKTSGPTVKRYDKAGPDSFATSESVCRQLAACLRYLTSEKNNKLTWAKITTPTGTDPSLLVAYCVDDFELSLTTLITGQDITNMSHVIEDIDDYIDATETVLNLIKAKNLSPNSKVFIAEFINNSSDS